MKKTLSWIYASFVTILAFAVLSTDIDGPSIFIGVWLPFAFGCSYLWTRKGQPGIRGYTLSMLASPLIAFAYWLYMPTDYQRVDQNQMANGMRKCPWCAEIVRADAIICRYCQRSTDISNVPAAPESYGASSAVAAQVSEPAAPHSGFAVAPERRDSEDAWRGGPVMHNTGRSMAPPSEREDARSVSVRNDSFPRAHDQRSGRSQTARMQAARASSGQSRYLGPAFIAIALVLAIAIVGGALYYKKVASREQQRQAGTAGQRSLKELQNKMTSAAPADAASAEPKVLEIPGWHNIPATVIPGQLPKDFTIEVYEEDSGGDYDVFNACREVPLFKCMTIVVDLTDEGRVYQDVTLEAESVAAARKALQAAWGDPAKSWTAKDGSTWQCWSRGDTDATLMSTMAGGEVSVGARTTSCMPACRDASVAFCRD